MSKKLLAFLIGLHPPVFRQRFGGEMMAALDESRREPAMLWDAFCPCSASDSFADRARAARQRLVFPYDGSNRTGRPRKGRLCNAALVLNKADNPHLASISTDCFIQSV